MGSDTLMKTCYVLPFLPSPLPQRGGGAMKRIKNWGGMRRGKKIEGGEELQLFYCKMRKKRNKKQE